MRFEELVLKPLYNVLTTKQNNKAFYIDESFYTYGVLAQEVAKIREMLQPIKDTNIGLVANDDLYTYASIIALWMEGKAYVPLHPAQPLDRCKDIISQVGMSAVLDSSVETRYTDVLVLHTHEKAQQTFVLQTPKQAQEDDLAYILFTSGSTGKPKGVCITYNNLNNFLYWYTGYYDEKEELVFLGHPPFSFDLSVMSLWPSIYLGASLVQIDKKHQENFKVMFEELNKSNATIWISTPSFIEMCFIDKNFNQSLMPKVKQFVFCGEKLFSTTVEKIHKNFENAQVINTYGPTESTVMVTWVEITKEVNKKYYENLPVGEVKWGTKVHLANLDEENKGEIVITGNTVAKGYFKNDAITNEKFAVGEVDGKEERSYLTGDLGYFKDGMLFCEGRIDFQVKLHGHRIELEDIDNNLLKNKKIRQAATVPSYEDGKVKALTSFVVYNEEIEKRFEVTKQIKQELKKLVPEYMVPKKIVFLEEMPLNNNGKIDKKKLKELV